MYYAVRYSTGYRGRRGGFEWIGFIIFPSVFSGELSDAPKIIGIGPVSAENKKIQNFKNHRLLF